MTHWRKVERDICDTLGEGAMWSLRHNAVFWVDILAPALNRMSLSDNAITRWDMPEPLGWVVEDTQGHLVGGFQSGIKRIRLDPLHISPMTDPEPHLPGNRMNDGKADRHGAIWCGTMDMAEEEERGTLYRLWPDSSVQAMDNGYMVPNGPAFSPCGRYLYHSDTARRTIYRFEIVEEGLRDKQVFARFSADDGYPDGMTVDADGGIWVAHWNSGRISRFGPDGMVDRAIVLPAHNITNIVFAGVELNRMFVTSARTGSPNSAYDGALFEVEDEAIGLPTGIYGG